MQQSMRKGNESKNMKEKRRERDQAFYTVYVKKQPAVDVISL